MYRILTELEWSYLVTAETYLYDHNGPYAFTDVREREDSSGMAMLWDDAMASVEMFVEDEKLRLHLVAERVARAQFHIVTGSAIPVSATFERIVSGEVPA